MTTQVLDEMSAGVDLQKVVWRARWRHHEAVIRGVTTPVPDWVHEGGSSVRWKVLEGHEELKKLAELRDRRR